MLEQAAQRFHCVVFIHPGFLCLLPGVDFDLGVGQFVTTFDLLLCGVKSLHAQQVVVGLRLAIPGFAAR
ncbi:hypothetical protein [Pseudomonas sp. TWRC1-2]|uniref:hypothetical protein n=1 Tax=Pseudomonas sp. TWRC1-2 TaxID=2804628 RepID=UPI003CEB443E